eukprot:TRINITY_DN6558_c0_g1_i2.p1 TRINITY_DN6558_c0_g1~~TRINITY_DN6558_c0_g1_i2.p1  ORF type:complete len:240 (+),score=50.54 TRINITY_DN6558_c0_g1_i2:108-827(+)
MERTSVPAAIAPSASPAVDASGAGGGGGHAKLFSAANSANMAAAAPPTREHAEKEHDPFKDTLARYFGYTNEVGEALRQMIKRWLVNSTYVVAGGYALLDTAHKYRLSSARYGQNDGIYHGGYTLLWQTLASVLIPPVFINRMCWAVNTGLTHQNWLTPRQRSVAAVLSGLAIIPFICGPIDHLVHAGMQRVYKPVAVRVLSPKRVHQDGDHSGGDKSDPEHHVSHVHTSASPQGDSAT